MAFKVLLVDDETSLLQGLSRALRKEPFEVVTTASAAEAIELLARVPIDVVVSDQDMPGMSGTDFLAEVHARHPATVRFMLTGKPTLDVAVAAINKGAISRFFTKPCDAVDLAYTIRQALAHKTLMQKSGELLRAARNQSNVLESLERRHPGITKVEKDTQGSVVLDLDASGCDQLVRAIADQVDRAEKCLNPKSD
jgi:DNA-binding NtrC family response regulator